MTRRCSHCSNNGHNSRTCPNRGVKIFGVRFDGGGSIRKCASMGNLSYYGRVSGGGSLEAAAEGGDEREKDGYASEDFGKGRERKKGVAWTEEEHKMFLLGLHQLGKGDWRGIARKYVVSRTATQVASHAQKYFIRQNHANRRKRRSSLFDMVPQEVGDAQSYPMSNEEPETESINPVPAPLSTEAEQESMNSNSSSAVIVHQAADVQPFPSDISRNIPNPETIPYPLAMMYTPYPPPFFPFSYPCMPWYKADATATSRTHSIVKPTAVHSTSPINVDELVGMSKLSLGETAGDSRSSSSMPINLVGGSSQRHSAFHTNNPSMSKLSLGETAGDSRSSSMPINLVGGSSQRHSAFHTNKPSTSGSRMNLSSSPPIHAM